MALKLKKVYNSQQHIWQVELYGEVDIHSSGHLKDALSLIVQEKIADIHIDCAELSYIDSTGLGVLIGILKKLTAEQYQLRLNHARPNILKLLNITGLNKLFISEDVSQ